MPAITTPVRVPRRPRLSTSDDISHLSLAEVRDRLARNERVLGSALLSTSPTATSGAFNFGNVGGGAYSPVNSPPTARFMGAGTGVGVAGPGPSSASIPIEAVTAPAAAGPMSPPGGAPLDDDPVRERLLAVREALRAREAELLAGSISSMSLEGHGHGHGLAMSPPTRSGKARALATIRQTENTRGARSGHTITLPITQTLALGTRDFDNQTAARLASMSLNGSRGPRRRAHPRHADVDDELGRAAAAAQYARAHVDDDDNDMFDTDEAYAAATVYAADRHDAGNGLPLTTAKSRREEGFDDDMEGSPSSEEDDDNEFAEGNDEYEGGGRGTMDASPDR